MRGNRKNRRNGDRFKMKWTQWTKGQGRYLLQKYEKSRTNSTIFEILKKSALSKVTISRHVGQCDFFRYAIFAYFPAEKLLFLQE